MQNRVTKAALNAAKGSLIGAANTIPGVSGGTIAVITRLYDELIASVSGFFRTGWKRNTAFLLPVVVGVAVGIVLFARIVDFFLTDYPAQTAFFFMGLILGSVPYLVKVTLRERVKPVYAIPFVIALGLLVVMSVIGRPPASEPITSVTLQNVLWIFLAGVVSSATMIIPGVSGSFVLLLIGMYSTFIRAARDLNLPVLAVLVPGFIVGIVLVSKVINLLLTRYHGVSYATILGLVLGSVVAIWPRVDAGWYIPSGIVELATGVGALVVGFALAWALGSERKERMGTGTEAAQTGDPED
jgi:putative membrane protein